MADDDKPRKRLPVISDVPIRHDVEDGLRFVHVMGMQTKHDLFDAFTRMQALLDELISSGVVDEKKVEERRGVIAQREVDRIHDEGAFVKVNQQCPDKYAVKGPEIDCKSLLHLCKGQCCKLFFPLSFQDLDERVVEWDYAMPYQIRKRDDGYCTHVHAQELTCTVYEKRPGPCRQYDCRNDKRIWLDFDKKIPAPDVAGRPPWRMGSL
jgi:hypothetical protein